MVDAGWWFQPTSLKNMSQFPMIIPDIMIYGKKNPNHQPNTFTLNNETIVGMLTPQTNRKKNVGHAVSSQSNKNSPCNFQPLEMDPTYFRNSDGFSLVRLEEGIIGSCRGIQP